MSGKGATGTVAILCGDPVVGRIIGNLLQAVGYEARPAEGIGAGELPGIALLFIAPGADPDLDLDGGISAFEEAGVPTLDLAASSWPCRIEEIKDAVENALSGKADKVAEIATELTPDLAPNPKVEPG